MQAKNEIETNWINSNQQFRDILTKKGTPLHNVMKTIQVGFLKQNNKWHDYVNSLVIKRICMCINIKNKTKDKHQNVVASYKYKKQNKRQTECSIMHQL